MNVKQALNNQNDPTELMSLADLHLGSEGLVEEYSPKVPTILQDKPFTPFISSN